MLIVGVLSVVIGLAIAFSMGDFKEFEKAQRKLKEPPKKTRIQKDLEARGRQVQVIDMETGEVYEPKEKV